MGNSGKILLEGEDLAMAGSAPRLLPMEPMHSRHVYLSLLLSAGVLGYFMVVPSQQ